MYSIIFYFNQEYFPFDQNWREASSDKWNNKTDLFQKSWCFIPQTYFAYVLQMQCWIKHHSSVGAVELTVKEQTLQVSSPRELFIPVWCNLTYCIHKWEFALLRIVTYLQGLYCVGRGDLEGFRVNMGGEKQPSSTALCWMVLSDHDGVWSFSKTSLIQLLSSTQR